MKQVFDFLVYAGSFLPAIAIAFSQSNLFWDCANGFVNSFSVHNDFNATKHFIKFLNFTYIFIEINVNVTYDGNRNFKFKLKPRINVSNKNAILIFLFLTTLFFYFR